ncbi:HET-domain-containing protein [Hyaloscypha variabilis F]|uniref:HET-domain-containing protein n=1 Tax=Hyaloscypha variabilis (strain UAMH 11265 / GT02V1 / F) TaxID=1149755 RepID=A0A2J6S143_HYAVF|nr:HET-domain-containing protein [Hyaloscypha variabilis F]
MRLINVGSEQGFFFEEFNEPAIPKYAILSHTWEKQELSYAEASAMFLTSMVPYTPRAGFEKLSRFANEARMLKLDYIWIDTCCIDKSSSAELSEAINSMYRWYHNATHCCIYLADVPPQPDNVHLPAVWSKYQKSIMQSRWLTRGWTLQELLAPRTQCRFYSMDWQLMGLIEDVTQAVSRETGIPMEAITCFRPERWSVAQKMSWAARRRTARIEDRAYSLLGLFNVNMPLIYGEGNSAFRRLQEEILKSSTDQTIFCWMAPGSSYSTWRGLLAKSPSEFEHSGVFVENKRRKALPFQLTNKGIQMTLKLVPGDVAPGDFIALLQCYREGASNEVGIYVQRTHDDNFIRVIPDRMANIPSSSVRKQGALLETVFAKPELANVMWRKSGVCSRIAGFRFPDITSAMSADGDVWIKAIAFNGQDSLWDGSISSFGVDHGKGVPESAIAICNLYSISDCSIEVWVKYDWEKSYGEDDDDEESSESDEITMGTESESVQSECCEWKIYSKSCDEFDLKVSSWIELDDRSDAYIHIELSDAGNHGCCEDEILEEEEEVSQIPGLVEFQV